jgi:CheY-like chemotaxis protein
MWYNKLMEKKSNLLIVEDSPMDMFLVRDAFTRAGAGWEITGVNHGEKAMKALLRQEEYSGLPPQDIVIIDLKIPRLSGFEVMEQIKTSGNLKNIVIIVLTSSLSETDRNESMKYSPDGYFVKPSDINGYDEMISQIISISKKPK